MSIVLDGSYLTVTEAAAELGLTTARVRQLIGRGQLEAEPASPRLWVIARETLDDFKKIDRPAGCHVDKRSPQPKAKPARSRKGRAG